MFTQAQYVLFPYETVILPFTNEVVTPQNKYQLDVLEKCYNEKKPIVAVLYMLDEENNVINQDYGCLININDRFNSYDEIYYELEAIAPVRLGDEDPPDSDDNLIYSFGEVLPQIEIFPDDKSMQAVNDWMEVLDNELWKRIQDENCDGGYDALMCNVLNEVMPRTTRISNILKNNYLSSTPEQKNDNFLDAFIYAVESSRLYYCIRLYEYKHYDKAIDHLQKLLEDTEFYKEDTAEYLFHSFYFSGDYKKAIEVFLDNKDILKCENYLRYNLMDSYFFTGEESKAVKYALGIIGEKQQPDRSIYGNPTAPVIYPNYCKTILNEMESGLSPFAVTEYLLPVLLSAREITAGYFDEFMIEESNREKVLNYLSKYLYESYGLFLFPMIQVYSNKSQGVMILEKIFIYKDTRYHAVLEDFKNEYYNLLEKNGIDDALHFQFLKEGELLGYPFCCINNAFNLRTNNEDTSFEKELSSKIVENSSPYRPKTYNSLFTFEFYPCKPGCENAHGIGIALEEKLRQFDPKAGEIYRDLLLTEHANYVLEWYNNNPSEHREKINQSICNKLGISWPGKDKLEENLKKNYESIT